MTTESERKKVLLVDDSPDFLESATRLLQELSGGAWDFLACSSGGEALTRLQTSPADLISLDVKMPVLDGVQLLGLLQRRFPSVLKVVLTGEATPEQRAACLTAGAELVLDKPTDPTGWSNLWSALDSLLHAPKEDGFRGVLRKVSLPDVIQMECLATNSSILEVAGSGMRGRVYIKTGRIIHAEIRDLAGVEALNTLLCLPGGSFHLLPFSNPGCETISGQWEFLLMEAARVRDESRRPGTNAHADPGPEALPDHAAVEAFATDPRIADFPPARTEPMPPAGTATSAAEAPPAETTTGMQPVIKETLICSLEGEVLYEWNCPNADDRIALMEFISRRAGTMTASLPLGVFERFECVDKGVRCVAKINGNEALFVRIQSVLAGGQRGTLGTP